MAKPMQHVRSSKSRDPIITFHLRYGFVVFALPCGSTVQQDQKFARWLILSNRFEKRLCVNE